MDPVTAAGRHRDLLRAASAVAAGAAVLVAVVLVRGSSSGGQCHNSLIPAYVSAPALTRLVTGPAPPRIVVVNPDNGPGIDEHRGYSTIVPAARRAGVRLLGYVHTLYGTRPITDVMSDVHRYRDWYGVDGIFFDEAAPDAAHLAYYRALAGQARAAGASFIALNPGVVPARGYFDVADVIVTFEGPYADYAAATATAPSWLSRLPARATAHLIYGATSEQALRAIAEGRAGHVYATSGELPNPWGTLPSYLVREEQALATCS